MAKNESRNKIVPSSDQLNGTCLDMCPKEEVKLREKEHLVHILEVKGLRRNLVKSFCRSAADTDMAVPRLLRPYPVLKTTVQYLLTEVTRRSDVPAPVVYDFVNDRLRAVRQDMTIQRLPPEQCMVLLEPMIRFYVFYGYNLASLPVHDFDPVLNRKYMLECIKWFLSCSDIYDRADLDNDLNRLSHSLSNLDLENKSQKKLICDRLLVEALYIICNLDDMCPVWRYLRLPKKLKQNDELKIVFKIAVENLKGNFVKVCKLSKNLQPLMFCAFCLYLPQLHRRGLQVLSQAYNSKQLTVPAEIIKEWLAFSSVQEVIRVCRHYGLKTEEGDDVHFMKVDFKADVNLTTTEPFPARVPLALGLFVER